MMTADEFRVWLKRTPPGGKLDYHSGDLHFDRTPSTTVLPESRRAALSSLADSVLRASEFGLVDLVRWKIGEGTYTYRAVKRRRP